MLEYNIGDVVIAIAGREMGDLFVVMDFKENKLLLVNGKNRKLDNPKIKNGKHVRKLDCQSAKELLNKKNLLNADIKKFLKTIEMGDVCQRKM